MSIIKNYYNSDLFNIEEILSILEMKSYIDDNDEKEIFIDYLIDVIEYYTPDLVSEDRKFYANYYDLLVKGDKHNYATFLSNLLNLEYQRSEKENNKIKVKVSENVNYDYSIISLNYDMVIEKYLKYLQNIYTFNKKIEIVNSIKEYSEDFYNLSLCKLHGSVDKKNIVPPTWNKMGKNDLTDTWKLANQLMAEANHIRVLGYSLPSSDSYIKYLFKNAILESENLKSIDVITLDKNSETEKRYKDFVKFNNFRFKNMNLIDYFRKIKDYKRFHVTDKIIKYDFLEEAHEKIMNL
jgi:hypothetical protein